MFRKKMLLVSIMLVLLLTGAAVGGTALAQGPDQAPPTPGPLASIMEQFWQSLADRFHVTVEEVHDAVAEAAAEALQPLVDEGKLPQERVDALVEKMRAGNVPPFFLPQRKTPQQQQRRRRGAILRFDRKMLEAAAGDLGMEPREVLGEIVGGKTLAQVVEDHGGDADAVLATLRDTADAMIDQALENGRLAEEQADKARERIHGFLDEHGLDIGARFFAAPFMQQGPQRRGHPFGPGQGGSQRPFNPGQGPAAPSPSGA